MNKIFRIIYEEVFKIYDYDIQVVYDALYQAGAYGYMGWGVIILPALFWIYFYYFYRNPYAKQRHWRLFYIFQIFSTALLISFIVYNYTYLRIDHPIFNPDTTEERIDYILHFWHLIFVYAIINMLLATITGYLWTLVLRTWSAHQIHLPTKWI